MPNIVECPTFFSFDHAVPDDCDRFLVSGKGPNVILTPFEYSDETNAAAVAFTGEHGGAEFGCIGLSAQGTVYCWFYADSGPATCPRDVDGMLTAAHQLTHTPVAAVRRAKSLHVVGWLDGLFSLQDLRKQGGCDAQAI